MCGIAGFICRGPGNYPDAVAQVTGMVQALKHRGPDDQGLWRDAGGRAVLGHRRLAIIDLSSEGHQPMLSRDGRYVISFNGEIYNYLELQQELKKTGVSFRGHSDTEALVEAVALWGLKRTLVKLVGMFAFALWDRRENKLTLARDRAGKKPLYYLIAPTGLYFASEIKALKVLKNITFPLRDESIYHYLTFGYVPAPQTIYQNVVEVPAAHYLMVDSAFHFKTRSFWQVPWGQKKRSTFAEAVEEGEQLLKGAVQMRLRADLPVGCFLSGGIDSGLLTALAATQMNRPLETFTVSFQEETFDEAPLANLVAKRYGTDHHVLVLSPNLQEILPQVARTYDSPLADASIIPSYCIAQEARKFLKIVLNGEGSDELFGGYRRQRAMAIYSRLKGLVKPIPKVCWRLLVDLLPRPRASRSGYAFAHRFLRGVGQDPFDRYIAWGEDGFTEEEKARLYSQDLAPRPSSLKLLRHKFGPLMYLPPLELFIAMDFLLGMHDDMLVKMDLATMAHGLEGRNPFLDHRLVEWAMTLPADIKFRGLNTKPLLRELAKRYLPLAIAGAPKRGFEIPLTKWLRHDLFPMVYDLCSSANGIVRSLFDKNYVEELVRWKTRLDPNRVSRRIFILFILALWEKEHR